ncbi:transporter [Ganoderma sinense ZZ0214-1]|uniref:Transporter n=1 Tax=Ganoderma sinense ZZ0214-1 TaxID=1077348 RepID=A0A2G8SJW1_9APHY|nr:transporter [Ganoderma sinense ZZ0214-1]
MSSPHPTTPVADIIPRPAAVTRWERMRNRRVGWLVECIAEAMGTFLYTFAGAGATAAFVLGNILKISGLGSLLQVGIAYAVGIALALTVCVAISEGHFNPGFTIHAVVMRGFPIGKALRLIVAQIFGSYIACLLVYVQYKQLIHAAIDVLKANGTYESVMFTPNGPGGIFGFYVTEGANLGYVVLNEFVCDFILGICIFGVLEPSNHFATPTTMPWLIALAYGVVVWGFAPVGVAANAARDLGGRFAALTLFGREASGGNYAAIAALTNIPAILLAGLVHDFVFMDSSRAINPEWHQLVASTEANAVRRAGGEPPSPSSGSVRSDGGEKKLEMSA